MFDVFPLLSGALSRRRHPHGDRSALTTLQTQTHRTSPGLATQLDLRARVQDSLDRAVDALFSKQHDDGHWCAELEGDSILSSEYLLMKAILGQRTQSDAEWTNAPCDSSARYEKICAYLRALQRADGTWGQYPGSGPDISATVKAYFALKIFGDDPDAPHMRAAREASLRLGGAERINTFSMFYLACLGQVSWRACPAIPPEVVLLPRWSPFHLDKVAAWTRTMILPLAICTALKPVRTLPKDLHIDELFVDERARHELTSADARDSDPVSWKSFFLFIDRAVKAIDKLGLMPLREIALERSRDWLVDRMRSETTDGLGAIFPPMVYIQVALQAMGSSRDDDIRVTAERELDRFLIEKEDHIRIQPCFSPVWDTGIALYALTEAGRTAERDERITRACEWLIEKEVNLVGDWVRNLRARDRERFQRDPGAWAAWAFEHKNDWYPDVDDTAMVAKAMHRATPTAPDSHPIKDAALRAQVWIRAMQNDDGGWAAFDRTQHREWMEAVPFADHNAMQDPSCPDITGRTIESLITCGVSRDDPMIRKAIDYLQRTQFDDGSWPGRWGVNRVYGAWQAVGGLFFAGENMQQGLLRKTLRWLRSIQNTDGGFGETADSYEDDAHVGIGPSTASQTAWGAMTLMFLTKHDDPAVVRAIEWLMRDQLDEEMAPEGVHEVDAALIGPMEGWRAAPSADGAPPIIASHPVAEPAGSWREAWFTGTGFPKVFYLRYHLYRHYFPVMALARWVNRWADEVGT